jgi:hypothetical protein
MREEVNAQRIELFMKKLGNAARQAARVYLVGGSTAVLLGWRQSTIDVDIKLVPEANSILMAVPELFASRLIKPDRLIQLFSDIEPQLYRYPAIDPPSFRRAVEKVVSDATSTPNS